MPRACSSAEILQGDSEWSELEKVRDEKWKGGIDEYSRQSEEEENDHRTGRERYERWLGENFGSLASSSHPSRWVKTLSLFLYLFIHLSLLPLFSWYSKHAIKGSVDQGTRRIPRTGPNRFDISSIFSSGAVECRASCTRGRTRWTIRSSSFRSGIRTCPVDKPCSTCSDSPSCGRRRRSAISIWCTTCDPHVRLKRIPRERGRERKTESDLTGDPSYPCNVWSDPYWPPTLASRNFSWPPPATIDRTVADLATICPFDWWSRPLAGSWSSRRDRTNVPDTKSGRTLRESWSHPREPWSRYACSRLYRPPFDSRPACWPRDKVSPPSSRSPSLASSARDSPSSHPPTRHRKNTHYRIDNTRIYVYTWSTVASNLDGDRLRPGGESGRSRIVGNPNAERVPYAIACQLILASSLEAVKFPIERAVVGIAENGAHTVTCDNNCNIYKTFFPQDLVLTFHATGAALTLRMFQPRIRRAR